MTYGHAARGVLDYAPCRYADARIDFRGPERPLDLPYVAFLGGTETYGKFVPRPYPDLVEEQTGYAAVNLGCVNGGIDTYLSEPSLLDLASGAEAAILQVIGAHNLSNRFYRVHPRRNDRFLSASKLLSTAYPDVDFTDFAFTRHMLGSLRATSLSRFEPIVEELKHVWVARMIRLVERIETRTILLWVGAERPGAALEDASDPRANPLFVTRGMVEQVARRTSAYIEVVAGAENRATGTRGMAFTELEAPAAAVLPGPSVHEDIAKALRPALSGLSY